MSADGAGIVLYLLSLISVGAPVETRLANDKIGREPRQGSAQGIEIVVAHSTVIPSAIPAVEAAKACAHVTKIGLGIITPVKNGEERLKFTKASGALRRCRCAAPTRFQLFWLYTNRPDEGHRRNHAAMGWNAERGRHLASAAT